MAQTVTNVWRELREKYGPAKGTYSPQTYSAIMEHHHANNAAADNPSNDAHPDNAQQTEKISTDLEDMPYALSMMDYLRIISQLYEHEKALVTLASIV